MNLSVKALLSWTKATIAADCKSGADITLAPEDFQDGELLLKLVSILKKEPNPCLCNCVEDRFKIIADFVDRDCRFNACKGTPISWTDILNGRNLTIEISKVLLLLVYHDLMNDHCTLRSVDTDTECQIASLTETFVMENEGCVSLKPGLDAHLSKRYLKIDPSDFDKSITASVSSVSTYDEDESPVFVRSQKVKFVELDSVASPSASCSPIQNIMNTPKYQLRKLQRQLIDEREYRDGLEKELCQRLEVLTQRESQINRMQYSLDKLKKEQGVNEQMTNEHLEELENKNNQMQSRFNEVLKQNKELKGDAALMEHQVDKLTEENGELSTQMRSMSTKLANFQAEIGRLRETQSTNEEEWRSTTSNLQMALNDAKAKEGDLIEQIEILKGRISCLEDQISRSTQQEEGDNMWISVEKGELENKICTLTDELDNKTNCLRQIEADVSTKTEQLRDCEREISDYKKQLLEMAEERAILHQEISTLKLNLEKAEQETHEQTKRLQLQLASCAEEIEKLKEIKQQKEESLFQTKEQIKDLMAKLCAANNLLAEKDNEVCTLTDKVDSLVVMHQQAKDEAQSKEEIFSQLLLEKSQEEEALQSNIKLLKDQVNSLKSSLKEAEDSLQVEKDLFTQANQEKCENIDMLHRDIVVCKKTIETLKNEIQVKDNQLMEIKNENSKLSDSMQEETQALGGQINGLRESLMKAEERIQTQQTEFTKLEEEHSRQKELLQQQLSSSEKMVKSLKDEIETKTDQMNLLENQSLEESELLKIEINDLQQQLTCLKTHLTKAQEDLHLMEKDFALKQQITEELQTKVSQFQDELKTLRAKLQIKEEELCLLRRETSTELDHLKADNLKQSQVLENEIQSLHSQVQSLHDSLNNAAQQLQVKEEMLARKEKEISCEKDTVQNLKTTLEAEIKALKQKIHTNEEQIVTLKNVHQQEKLSLKNQLDDIAVSLSKAEERVQTQLQMLTEQELKTAQDQQVLQQKLVDSQAVIRKLEDEVRDKEHKMAELKTHGLEQSSVLMEKNECLQRQLDSLAASLKDTEDKMHLKETSLTQQQQEHTLKQQELCDLQIQIEQAEKKMMSFQQVNNQLQVDLRQKDAALEKSQEQCQIVERELTAIKMSIAEKNEKVLKLREDAVVQAELIHKAKDDVKNKDNMLNELKEQSSQKINTLQQSVESLKGQLEDCSQKLVAKEEQLLKIQLESSQQIDNLNQEIVSLNTELNQHKELHAQVLRQNEEMLDSIKKERDDLVEEKGTLNSKVFAVEKQLELLVFENQKLDQAKEALEREKLHTKLQNNLQMLKQEKDDLLKKNKKVEDTEIVKKDLLEQLSAKSAAAEHYKVQMEKAVSHYNGKKQLLQQSEEVVANLKQSLEMQENEAKTVTMENKILQMELDKIQSNEKLLLNKIACLEAQLSFADKALREQNRIPNYDRATSQFMASNLDVPTSQYGMRTTAKARSMSSDSLDQNSADDSLNSTRKLCAPGESSTPLVRSSERLAAKRQGLKAESLETLYFTPISTRHRVTRDSRPEESARKDSASSVKRRRTTQVINITMTKKTPGCKEADETFYSLPSARSHPNLSSAHKAQGIATELFVTPAKVTGSDADQLMGLPGYRRSTIHSQATSTFCVGAENEPEGGPEEWMRIAELQARNKACLPHLKSSYPVEFDAVRNSALTFTDEELRTGDPIETIRRASLMPGQLQDSLSSHRLSYMMGQGGSAATARSRLSLMPGQEIPVSYTLRSPKGTKRTASTLSLHSHIQSPEKKVRASCFPRPLTPKNKNVPAVPSPADRRQSMMFSIENTPRKDFLRKGLSKLRSSTRKSPGKSVKKSPAQSSNRRGQENMPTRNGRTAIGGAGRLGSQKSPMVTSKGTKKSPQVSTRAAKSPGLTASARKMMRRMKV